LLPSTITTTSAYTTPRGAIHALVAGLTGAAVLESTQHGWVMDRVVLAAADCAT
jgi:hypothetical protein